MTVRVPVLGMMLVLSACGASGDSDLKVTNVWAQPVTAAGTSAAVYMTISTNCTTGDVLQSVETPSPQQASLHASSEADDTLRMTPLKSISIACGKPNLLKPMGMHVMVMDIRKPVGIGDRLPLTLHFARAGAIPVQAEVTSMAVLEDVDPMHMHGKHSQGGAMKMDHGNMH